MNRKAPLITRRVGSVKVRKTGNKNRATCFATLLQNEVKKRRKTTLATSFVERQVCTWVVKRASLLFNSFCSNVAKQVSRFLLPVLL